MRVLVPVPVAAVAEPAPGPHAPGAPDPGPSPRGSTYYHSLLACPREHALVHELAIVPDRIATPLQDGLHWHRALQAYYSAMRDEQRAWMEEHGDAAHYPAAFFFGGQHRWQRAAIEAIAPLANDPDQTDSYARLTHMLDAYFERTRNLDRWQVLAVEETVEWWAQAAGHLDYTARLDAVICDHAPESHGTWIVEHKSCRSITPELIDNYQMDLQILGQVWLFLRCIDPAQLPAPFRGVRVNLCSKGRHTQIDRVDVCPSPQHLAAFENTVTHLQALRAEYEARGWPQWLGHCAGYARGYGRCPYYDLCHAFPTVPVDTWREQPPPLGYHRREQP